MRTLRFIATPVLFLCCASSLAAASGGPPADEQALALLQARAQKAGSREQCFLYTQLIRSLTEIAGQQLLSGDSESAAASLHRIEEYAALIHHGLAHDTKRVKEAEMMMQAASFHLDEYLHRASDEDKAAVQAALRHLDGVHTELLAQVFAH